MDTMKFSDNCGVVRRKRPGANDSLRFNGGFTARFYKHGQLFREDAFKNTVIDEGKGVLLDAGLSGSAYTVTGPYMGLISSLGFFFIAVTDTAANINSGNGWQECGASIAPTYTVPRKTCVWSATVFGAKSLSAPLAFAFTGNGTVKGAFIVFGSGASATVAAASGKLWSAGLFTGGDQVVDNTTTLDISYEVNS